MEQLRTSWLLWPKRKLDRSLDPKVIVDIVEEEKILVVPELHYSTSGSPFPSQNLQTEICKQSKIVGEYTKSYPITPHSLLQTCLANSHEGKRVN